MPTPPLPTEPAVFSHAGSTWAAQPVRDNAHEWLVLYRFEAQGGSPVVAEMRVLPLAELRGRSYAALIDGKSLSHAPAPPGGLTARRLRTIPFGDVVPLARERLAALSHPIVTARRDAMGYRESVLREPKRPGRRGREPAHYARIAAMYLDAVDRGSRRPAEEVAAELGAGYSSAYVRDVLAEARRRGLLTKPPRRGVPGGQLTERGLAALREQEER